MYSLETEEDKKKKRNTWVTESKWSSLKQRQMQTDLGEILPAKYYHSCANWAQMMQQRGPVVQLEPETWWKHLPACPCVLEGAAVLLCFLEMWCLQGEVQSLGALEDGITEICTW